MGIAGVNHPQQGNFLALIAQLTGNFMGQMAIYAMAEQYIGAMGADFPDFAQAALGDAFKTPLRQIACQQVFLADLNVIKWPLLANPLRQGVIKQALIDGDDRGFAALGLNFDYLPVNSALLRIVILQRKSGILRFQRIRDRLESGLAGYMGQQMVSG